jgi:Mg-chelatase subunit ChlD
MNNTTSTPTDLAIIEKMALDKLTQSLAKSDLDDLLRGARRSLLLVDCSGSMGDHIRTGGRKIDALRTVVANIRETNPVPVAAFGADGADVQVVDSIPEPCGGTPLARAIQFGAYEGATHLVVVTDGIPDSQSAAFAAASDFKNPIDVIYIGDGNDHGAKFCQELARMTGGTVNITDLGKPKELAGQIVLMLGDGN